jgi:L-rhamnose isomerase
VGQQPSDAQIQSAYALAQERYAAIGVDTAAALARLAAVPISLHCWQGDDVGGFESRQGELGGGLAVTGNYPGKARTADELRQDLDQTYRLIPGRHRLNLHAIYLECERPVARDEIELLTQPCLPIRWQMTALPCPTGMPGCAVSGLNTVSPAAGLGRILAGS